MTRAAWILAALALLSPLPAAAAPPAQEEGRGGVEHLKAWPALDKDVAKQARKDVSRLIKARTPEMAESAEAALVEAGAGVVPLLLPAFGKEKDEEAVERIRTVLDAVTGAEHTRLLAKEFGHRSLTLRTWAMGRCAAFPDPGTRREAEAAMKRVLGKGDKAEREDRVAAALCATASGSLEGFGVMRELAVDRWGKHGESMRTALEAVRGPEAVKAVQPLFESRKRKELVAALRLLAGCGDADARAIVLPHLDSNDNSIRVAAINAMRGIVDGDPPVKNLPVFEAIELAKQWKARG